MNSTARTVVIVGQGYVGLPVAMRAVEVGFRVVGVDLNERRVASLRAGESYVDDVPDHRLTSALSTGRYLPTHDYSGAADFDVALITVPTPLQEGLPDLSFIEDAARSLAAYLGAVDNEVSAFDWPENIEQVDWTANAVAAWDIATVVTDHDNLDYSLLTEASLPVLDTKNLLRGSNIHRL